MRAIRRIRWVWVVVAGLLAEASIFAVFFLLLFAATLAGRPEIARPGSALDYADAMVSSFAMVFLFTLWLGKRIESHYVLHGMLVGLVGILLFMSVLFAFTGSFAEPPLYVVAHVLKILGGIAGGLVAERRKRHLIAVERAEAGG